MRQLHAGVVVGEDVVVAVLAPVGGELSHRARLLGSHLDRPKLLQEELVVVGPHHQQFVDEARDGDGWVGLQGLRPVVLPILGYRVHGLVTTATREADRAVPLKGLRSFRI